MAQQINIIPRSEHPNPMMKRSEWKTLNGEWEFVKDAKRLYCIDIKTGNNGQMFTSCDDCIKIAVRKTEEVLGL